MAKSINSFGKKRRVHLYYHPRKTKSRGVVHEYSLATCYFENGKNQKKIIQSIGELTETQAEQYRFLLRAINGQIDVGNIVDLSSVLLQEQKNYLDVLVMDSLWKRLGLDQVFDATVTAAQKLSTEQVARILTLNRLLKPQSKIRTIEWFRSTKLDKVMGIDLEDYERNKIFRELDHIHKHKSQLEKTFWKISRKEAKQFDAYYFDGSTSWFEGNKCPLAEADLEKTRGYFPKVVGLMLITDNQGYPVAWEMVNGHSKDTTEFKVFLKRISEDFGIKNITYCFDRGVASVSNFDLIGENNKFVSAIRDNQIKDVLDLEKFQVTRAKIIKHVTQPKDEVITPKKRRIAGIDGFLSFDDNRFFSDLGVHGKYRYVASFSHDLFMKEDADRQHRIKQTLMDISEKNLELALAKKDRDYNVTERDLLGMLAKYRVTEFFEYSLLPLTTSDKAQSYRIECQMNFAKVKKQSLTDGILVYITDHLEKIGTDFALSAYDIVSHYKGKYVVENAFREIKSFIELRPFFVWTEEHVKAHYDIAIISCFINNYIGRKLGEMEMSIRDFYTELEESAPVVKLATPSGIEVCKMKPISEKMKQCLKKLEIQDITSPSSLHKRHGIFQ